MKARVAVFALVAGGVAIAIAVFVAIRAIRARSPAPAASESAAARARAELAQRPHVLFRSLELEPSDAFGRLEASALEPPSAIERASSARVDAGASCMRVHFARARSAVRRGLCFVADASPDEHGSTAILRGLDARWTPTWSRSITGIPSRLRVSPHGALGAATVFVTGHSYDDTSMSTQTLLVDLETGATIADLEDFEIRRGDTGERLSDAINLWGVTFAQDDDTFYVTVARGDTTWLAKGSVSSRALRTLRENVECPSLSPDERTLAFKKRGTSRADTHLFALDVDALTRGSTADRALPEERVVDDQVEWLDARTILYKYGMDVWAAGLDDARPPRTFLERASSPAIVE
ncbi:MAG: hypothetical protein U0414_29530 [Polyangiaceae bacterium]